MLKQKIPDGVSSFNYGEYNLNYPIDCCAAALNWIIDQVQSPKFECDDMKKIKPSKQTISKLMSLAAMATLMQIMSFLGTYAAIYGGVNIIKN